MKTIKNLLTTTALAISLNLSNIYDGFSQEIKNAILIYTSADKKEEKISKVDSIKPYKLSYTSPAMGLIMEALSPEEAGFDPPIRMYILNKTENGLDITPATIEGAGWYDFSKDHSKKTLREVYSIFNDTPKENLNISESVKYRLSTEKNAYSPDVKNALLAYVSLDKKEPTTFNIDSIKPCKLSYKTPSSAKLDFDLPIKLYIIKTIKKRKKLYAIPTILKWGYDFSKDPKKEVYNLLTAPRDSISVSEPVKYWSSDMFFELIGKNEKEDGKK